MSIERTAALLTLTLLACGTGAGDGGLGDASSDGATTPDAETPDATSADATTPDTCEGAAAGLYLMRRLDFGREEPAGVAAGLDLDDRVSDEMDAEGCFVPDLVDADGTPGIDNKLGTLTPTLETALGRDFAVDFRDAIARGELLLLLELDVGSSGEATVTLLRGQVPGDGSPALDDEGLVAAGQALNTTPLSVGDLRVPVEGVSATCEGAAVSAGPVDLPMPWPSLDMASVADIALTVYDATVDFETTADGRAHGFIAGHLVIQELLDGLRTPGEIMPPPPDPSMMGNGDLDPNDLGVCQSMSLALVFDAVAVVAAE